MCKICGILIYQYEDIDVFNKNENYGNTVSCTVGLDWTLNSCDLPDVS